MPDDGSPITHRSESEAASRLPEARARRTRNRLVLLAVAAVVLVLAAVGVVNWWTVGRFMQSTNDAYLRADQVVVAPKVQGYVTAVLVSDNQDVAAGQPLVRIDPRPFKANYAQAMATVDARQADIAAAQAQIAQQTAVIAQTQAQLASARTAATFAAGEVERYRPLAASGADTPEKLEQLANTRDQARQSAAANARRRHRRPSGRSAP
ncbi:MAG: biotin/lipoyl-binding protein [Caulobacteraceae bacterium]